MTSGLTAANKMQDQTETFKAAKLQVSHSELTCDTQLLPLFLMSLFAQHSAKEQLLYICNSTFTLVSMCTHACENSCHTADAAL